MNKLLIFLCAILFCSFIFSDKRPKHIILSDKICDSFVKDLKKKGLSVNSCGGGFIDKVNEVHLGFNINKNLSMNESRKLIIDLSEDFLYRYNNNSEIRPYLLNYPFLPENIQIFVLFNTDNVCVDDERAIMRSVSIKKGRIQFRFTGLESNINKKINEESILISLPDNENLDLLTRQCFYGYTSIYHETYDEAYRLVYGHKRSIDHP